MPSRAGIVGEVDGRGRRQRGRPPRRWPPKAGATAFASHSDLAASGLCDAVVITTPPVHARTDPRWSSLAQGIPLLCEKPLTVDLQGAFLMTRAATEHGVLLSMASKFRFCDDVVAAHDMLNSGAIGTPMMLDNVFTGFRRHDEAAGTPIQSRAAAAF